MAQRIFIVFFLVVLLSACPRKNGTGEEICISGIQTTFIQSTTDTTRYLLLNFEGETADSGFPDLGFGNAAYALMLPVQKLCRGIKTIKITSSRSFNAIQGGEDLSGELVASQTGTEIHANLLPIILQKGDLFQSGIYLRFIHSPAEKTHNFKIVLTDNHNNTFTAETGEVVWE